MKTFFQNSEKRDKKSGEETVSMRLSPPSSDILLSPRITPSGVPAGLPPPEGGCRVLCASLDVSASISGVVVLYRPLRKFCPGRG